MASSFTLATLKAALQDHVEDTGTPLSDNLDMLIQLGEDRVLRDLPLTIFDDRDDVSITQGNQVATKPTGALVTRELYYVSASVRYFLRKRTQAFCNAYAPTTTEAAPKYFADDYSETTYLIAPEPNLSVTAEALFTKRPTSLVTDTTGTWLSENVGDLLLHACLISIEKYNLADERIALWVAEYGKLLAAARVTLRDLLPGER
jgi:hypothetical protein